MALGQEGITPRWFANLPRANLRPAKISILKSSESDRLHVCVWWIGVLQIKSLRHGLMPYDCVWACKGVCVCLPSLHVLINCFLSWKSTQPKLLCSPPSPPQSTWLAVNRLTLRRVRPSSGVFTHFGKGCLMFQSATYQQIVSQRDASLRQRHDEDYLKILEFIYMTHSQF